MASNGEEPENLMAEPESSNPVLEANEPERESYSNPTEVSIENPEGENAESKTEVPDSKFGEKEYLNKFNQKGRYDKDYYKNRASELKEQKHSAAQKKDKARDEAKQQKMNYKAAKNDQKSRSELKEIKKEKNQAQKDARAANREYRKTSRQARANKIDDLKSKAYMATHPMEAAKQRFNPVNRIKRAVAKQAEEIKKQIKKKTKQVAKKAAKKAAVVTKKSVKGIVKFIIAHPDLSLVILIIIAVIGLIMVIVMMVASNQENMVENIGQVSGVNCSYPIQSKLVSPQIELINCDATADNYMVLATIPFEKYVAGVALAEMGQDYLDEAMKAQIIAVRSYTLTRNVPEYGVGYDETRNVIRLRACENDQVYWDYTSDIYRDDRGNVSLYSPEYKPSPGEEPWKKALSPTEIARFESLSASVLGMYAIDENGQIVVTSYDNTITQNFIDLAQANLNTVDGQYFSILTKNYSSIKNINQSECVTTYLGEIGEFSSWKQSARLGAPWAGYLLGVGPGTTIDRIGCLVVSLAMQIASSGVDVSPITDFNPQTFAAIIKKNGCLSNAGAVVDYTCITKVFPEFHYEGTTQLRGSYNDRKETIKFWANQGEYIVIEVREYYNSQHWVALDAQQSIASNWQNVYIWDPASRKTTMESQARYMPGKIVRFSVQKKN